MRDLGSGHSSNFDIASLVDGQLRMSLLPVPSLQIAVPREVAALYAELEDMSIELKECD